MPTNRRRVRRPSQSEPWVKDYYLNGYQGQGRRALMYGNDGALLAYPWEEAKKELLPEWILSNPCTRPWAFWEFDAPGPRRRLGGTGRRERNAGLQFGAPSDVWWKDVDPADPPRYESEASYLQRHGFLTTAEKKWLADHPEALDPEAIEYRLATGPDSYPMGYSGPGYYEDREDI